MPLANAYDRWKDAECEHIANPGKQTAEAADEAYEALAAVAFQNGYDPASGIDVVAWVYTEIAE